jgi:hypothetical protein
MTSAVVFARHIENYRGQLAVLCRHADCTVGSEVEHLVCVVVDYGYGARAAVARHLASHEGDTP